MKFSVIGRLLATVVLAAVVFSQVACGFDFATGLRTALRQPLPFVTLPLYYPAIPCIASSNAPTRPSVTPRSS